MKTIYEQTNKLIIETEKILYKNYTERIIHTEVTLFGIYKIYDCINQILKDDERTLVELYKT